jgi:hypothetical protein
MEKRNRILLDLLVIAGTASFLINKAQAIHNIIDYGA